MGITETLTHVSKTRAYPYCVILVLAALLMVPTRFSSPLNGDSFWIDFVWADQFSALLRDGTLYPRWLPESHDGLGAPVFYFYPPLSFYLTGVFALIGLSTYWSIIAAFGAALAASGMTMYHWLKGWTALPLVGALLYMVAPYHIIDFYNRGALAEFCAFALVPLIAIGITRAAHERRFGMLAMVYAALIMTHLPAALLTSLFLIAPYCLILMIKDRTRFRPLTLGVVFGIGIASLYLLPMLTLQSYSSLDTMVADPVFQTANWSVLDPSRWASPNGVVMACQLSGIVAFGAIILLCARREVWGWAALGYVVIVLGLVPGLWSLPLLTKVQFPWRTLMLAEFAVVTAFARTRLSPVIAAVAVTPMLALSAVYLQLDIVKNTDGLAVFEARHPDVVEYLPSGAAGAKYSALQYSQWALDLAAQHRAAERVGHDVIQPDFYFPSWEVRCDGAPVAAWPDPATKLLRSTGTNCTSRIGKTSAEWIGLGLSALFLIALAGLTRRGQNEPSGARGG